MPQDAPAGERSRFQMFGGPVLFRHGTVVDLSPLQAALLGLLLGGSEGILSRNEILGRFWADEDATKARKRLNQLIYSLKQRAGEPLLIHARREKIFRAPEVIRTDLDDFQEALEASRFLTCFALLDQGFLRDLEGAITRDFSDWVQDRRAEMRNQLRRRAERRWIECERNGEWAGAAIAGEALLSMHPGNEGHLRRLMEARGKAGLLTEAEAAFREFQSRAVGPGKTPWVPERETAELLVKIRSLESPAGKPQATKILHSEEDPPLIGRENERALLRRTLRRIPHQALRGILLIGEAGIGKTRLIGEALQGIQMEGQGVLSSNAAELEQLIPLNPLIEACAPPWVGSALRGLDEPWRTVLFGVMPAHYLGEGPIPEAPQIQAGSVPRRLFEAIHQLLLGLVRMNPVILVLEDLQWADQTTLSVLEFLIRRWDQGGFQLLVSVRAEEVHRNPTLATFMEILRSHGDFLEIAVNELDGPTSESLIRCITSRPLAHEDIAYLHSLAGGNPFYLIELTLEFLAGRVEAESGPREPLQIPLSIRQVLGRRLSQLSPDAERVLGSLAVYSRPLGMQGIAKIARIPISRCMLGFDQLSQFRLVTNRGIDVAVRHELIRHTVYQAIPEPTKAWFHGRIGHYLLKARERPPVDELAVHFDRAGLAAEAREYALEAAARAESSGAIPETLRFLRIAREHSQNPEEVAELIGRMGHLNYLHQNLEEAAPLLELAVGRFRRIGRISQALEWEVERLDSLAQTASLPWREWMDELDRVKKEARGLSDWKILTKALDVQAHQYDHKGDLAGVREVLLEAEGCADLGGPHARCTARTILALNVYYGSPQKALEAAREAVAFSEETSDNNLQLNALNRLIVVLLYQGLLGTPEGAEVFLKAEERSKHSGDLNLKFFVKQNRAVWHLEIGRYQEAMSGFLTVEPLLRDSKARHARTLLLLNMGEALLALHDVPLARAKYSEAESLIGTSSPVAFRTIISAGQGICALHEGELAEARHREEELPPLPDYWAFDPSVVVSFKCRMLMRRGDKASADRLLASVAEGVRERLVTAWVKLVIERGKIRRRQDLTEARQALLSAIDIAKRLGLTERLSQLRALAR